MTDEEMAEEYYYKTYPVTLNIGEEERKKKVTDIFLAGLRSGRPEWHDLRKDQNDLPDNDRYVWTNVGAGYHDDDGWWDDIGWELKAIAWCEPKFEKDDQFTKYKKDDQLAKAKKLLRKFLESKSIEETCVIESETEQFLKETEK